MMALRIFVSWELWVAGCVVPGAVHNLQLTNGGEGVVKLLAEAAWRSTSCWSGHIFPHPALRIFVSWELWAAGCVVPGADWKFQLSIHTGAWFIHAALRNVQSLSVGFLLVDVPTALSHPGVWVFC